MGTCFGNQVEEQWYPYTAAKISLKLNYGEPNTNELIKVTSVLCPVT